MYLAMHLLDIKTAKNNFWSWYSGSQSHTTRRGRDSCSLWYAPVANVCDLLLFLDENRVIPDFRHFWKVTSPDEGGGPRVVVSTAAFHARVRGSVPGLGGLKETKLFLPHPRVKVSIVGSLRDREVACSASDRQGSNFESCVWRTVSSQSSHHSQEVLLVQFSLYVHKGGLSPIHFISFHFTSPDKELLTVLYFPFDAFPMTWPRKLFSGLNSTGMMVTWLRTLANTRP